MPAYNFKKQFINDILTGRKTSTIRPKRRLPTVAGDILYLYTGLRTNQARLLHTTTCVSVDDVDIHDGYLVIHGERRKNGGYRVDGAALEALARKDGFETVEEFFDFFRATYRRLPLVGQMEIITWPEPPRPGAE